VGFDQPQSLHEYSAFAALPMWIQFMKLALKDQPDHPLPPSSNIVKIYINAKTGMRTSLNDKNGMFEYFMEPYLPEGKVAVPQELDNVFDPDPSHEPGIENPVVENPTVENSAVENMQEDEEDLLG
jgi:penicillin-binding protein 1A